MGFIIRSNSQSQSELEKDLKINNKFDPADAWSWRETQRVTFTRDGTLSSPSIIALGNQGDDWATRLECVIDGDIDIGAPEYLSRYTAHIVFVCVEDGTRTPLKLIDNKYLYVPQEITQNAGDYQMILVITEKDDEIKEETEAQTEGGSTENTEGDEGNENPEVGGETGPTGPTESTPEQAAGEQEIFTSQLFQGSVVPTLYPIIKKFHEQYDIEHLLQAPVVNLEEESLSKPIINMYATRGELEPINQKLGYLHDRFITPLEIHTKWVGEVNQFDAILLYFITTTSTDDEQPVVGVLAYSILPDDLNSTSDSKRILAWVPKQVTQRAGTWQIVMVGVDNNGAEWYSNTITGQVIDNTLQAGDLDPNADVPYLYDVNGKVLVVSLNDEVEVPLLTRSTQSYKLNYTGAEVQALLDSIPTKQDQLTAGDNIEITETDVISAEVPTFGVDPETGTLVVNTNKSK